MAAGGLSAHATDRGVNKAPREQHVVQALPGVGRKTANMILNTAVSQPTIPVGTPFFGSPLVPASRQYRYGLLNADGEMPPPKHTSNALSIS